MAKDEDWRLQLDLEEPADLERLLGDVRDSAFEHDARESLADEVVLTHDGSSFFAYAMTEGALKRAREAIESVLRRDERHGSIRVCHWDSDLRQWRQTDPPLSDHEARLEQERARKKARSTQAGGTTRTVACVIGKLIRKSFERQMLGYANELALQCEIVEHPHLLSTQVAFNVTGPQSAIDQFDQYLRSEARATTRLDPGLVPFGLP